MGCHPSDGLPAPGSCRAPENRWQDAWNRLTKVKTQHDKLTLAAYTYDAPGVSAANAREPPLVRQAGRLRQARGLARSEAARRGRVDGRTKKAEGD